MKKWQKRSARKRRAPKYTWDMCAWYAQGVRSRAEAQAIRDLHEALF